MGSLTHEYTMNIVRFYHETDQRNTYEIFDLPKAIETPTYETMGNLMEFS